MFHFFYSPKSGERKAYAVEVTECRGGRLWGRNEQGQLKSFYLQKVQPHASYNLTEAIPALVTYLDFRGERHTEAVILKGQTEDVVVFHRASGELLVVPVKSMVALSSPEN